MCCNQSFRKCEPPEEGTLEDLEMFIKWVDRQKDERPLTGAELIRLKNDLKCVSKEQARQIINYLIWREGNNDS
jgi:hypothetical protein